MDIVSYHFSVKKKQAEEVINQLIGEVELAMSESKRLKDIYRTVKAGKTFNANTIYIHCTYKPSHTLLKSNSIYISFIHVHIHVQCVAKEHLPCH